MDSTEKKMNGVKAHFSIARIKKADGMDFCLLPTFRIFFLIKGAKTNLDCLSFMLNK